MNKNEQKFMEALKGVDEVCDMLLKAMPSGSKFWAGVLPDQKAPDHTDEQVIAARGSELPISHTDVQPEAAAGAGEDSIPMESAPQLPEGVREDLVAQYTPEKLHAIVQHASKSIADALMSSIIAHQSKAGTPVSAPKEKPSVGE
jgi:hypothetical protein